MSWMLKWRQCRKRVCVLCKQFLKMTMPSLFNSYYLSPCFQRLDGDKGVALLAVWCWLRDKNWSHAWGLPNLPTLCREICLWTYSPSGKVVKWPQAIAPMLQGQKKVSEELDCNAKIRNQRHFYFCMNSIFLKSINLINRVRLIY